MNVPRTKTLLAVTVLIIGVASGYLFYTSYPGFKDALPAPVAETFPLPEDLHSYYFYKKAGEGGYYFENGAFSSVDAPQNVERTRQQVSPDGTKKAYTKSVTPSMKVDGEVVSVDFSKWSLVVEQEGDERPLANGYAPRFLDNDNLAYFSSLGIVIYNFKNDTYQLIHKRPETVPLGGEVQYSLDGKRVMWVDASNGQKFVGKIAPNGYETTHVFSGAETLILTDATVYEFAFVPEGTAFFTRGFDGSERTRAVTFPSELGIRGAIR